MLPSCRPFLAAALLALPTLALAQHTPHPTPAQVEADTVDDYVYSYPLVLMNAIRQRLTNVPKAASGFQMAPPNQFGNTQTFPDETFTYIVSPNADTLYSQSWFDLSQGPQVLTVGDMQHRYFLLPMMDAWSNVMLSPGTRTTGNGPQTYLLTGPGWSGKVPDGMTQVKSPTDMVWLLGRIQTNGKSDFAYVQGLQKNLKITPLSEINNPSYTPPPHTPDPNLDMTVKPIDRVEHMDAATFFNTLAALLVQNPPLAADGPAVAKLRAIGVVAGKPFDLASKPEPVRKAIEAGFAEGLKKVTALSHDSDIVGHVNGWMYLTANIGTYGTNYDARAGVARMGIGANMPADAIYYNLRKNADGPPLTGAHNWVLHFPKGQLPPAGAFWSVSIYDDRQLFHANPIHRFAIGDRDPLVFNADGSLDIYVQHESPGPAKEANWLPSPPEGFNLIMRVYWPKPEVLSGAWAPPALTIASAP